MMTTGGKYSHYYKQDDLCAVVNPNMIDLNAKAAKHEELYRYPVDPILLTTELRVLDIKVEKGGFPPKRGREGDACFDVFSPKEYTIWPFSDILIPLNFRVSFPKTYGMFFFNKSSMSTKNRLFVGAGVIDSGYRGIVHCHLFSHTFKINRILKGQKIAQFAILRLWDGTPFEVDEIDTDTDRGEGGFGSTGK